MVTPTEDEMKDMLVKKMAQGMTYEKACDSVLADTLLEASDFIQKELEKKKINYRQDTGEFSFAKDDAIGLLPGIYDTQAAILMTLARLLSR